MKRLKKVLDTTGTWLDFRNNQRLQFIKDKKVIQAVIVAVSFLLIGVFIICLMTQISNIAYVLYNNNQEYEENKNDLKRVDMYETMSNGGIKLTFHDGTTAEFLTSEEYKFYVVPDLSSDETYYQEDDNAILVGIDENYGWSLIKSSNMVYVWGYMLFFLFLMYLGRQAQMPLLGSNAVKWGYIALFILLSFVTIYLLSYNFI